MVFRFLLRISALLPGLIVPTIAWAQDGIQLLECIDGVCEIPAGEGLGAFGYYFSLLYPWIIGTAAGIAVLWGVMGGIAIMNSGGDQSKEAWGKERLMHALLGLLLIIFSGVILNFLNPTFYR